ncbi:hypothetical protein B0H16DRAFT_1762887 [Mycena metata]|uniref:Uncharacterized protein n=1 Tax=Mycena metata TaxID=1033252 RepID=A0AAD7MY45_9AGAR|nr:hypothetical protein B0H16DRAFT_1762887 [Mycena metata]
MLCTPTNAAARTPSSTTTTATTLEWIEHDEHDCTVLALASSLRIPATPTVRPATGPPRIMASTTIAPPTRKALRRPLRLLSRPAAPITSKQKDGKEGSTTVPSASTLPPPPSHPFCALCDTVDARDTEYRTRPNTRTSSALPSAADILVALFLFLRPAPTDSRVPRPRLLRLTLPRIQRAFAIFHLLRFPVQVPLTRSTNLDLSLGESCSFYTPGPGPGTRRSSQIQAPAAHTRLASAAVLSCAGNGDGRGMSPEPALSTEEEKEEEGAGTQRQQHPEQQNEKSRE